MAGADSADQIERDASPVEGSKRKPAGRGVTGPKFFTNAGPRSGPILWRDDCAAIDVLRAPDDPTPIGMAVPAGSTEGGITLWTLTVGDAVLPRRWIVLGREFRPVKENGRAPRA
jgi:hypothetical protein